MKNDHNSKFNTNAVHAGYHAHSGPVNPPIEESSTYAFESCDDGAERFASKDKEGIYSRLSSPTVNALEKKIAKLENGYGGIATGSGIAAVSAIYFHFLDKDSHAIATASMYGPSRTILENSSFYKKWGAQSTLLDTSVVDDIKKAIRPNTKLIYIETPANPTLAITDISKVSAIAKEHKIPLVVDNTFCSPYLQNPLDWGADVVLHSMTKSIGGHATAVGGILIAKTEKDYYGLRSVVTNTGGILSPHDAILFFSGVKTLGIRMERMQESAIRMADYLRNHEKITWIFYPGYEDHPMYYLVGKDKQMRGPGALMSFGVKGGLKGAKTLLDNVKLNTLAVSLGGVESLIQSPALMTHAGVPKEEREKAGIKDELVRYSIGIEEFEDLRADMEQALAKI
ncbi:MAG: methionine gamma-lyase [Candidatus Zixiibacteriota bacterium]|nr:MAG: methionine gamma-lyase [candidate division Zixibacteria bacterium]